MKNKIKQHRIDIIMNLDRGRYVDCVGAVARLMDGFDIPTEFQPNLLLDAHDALRSALKECNSDDNDQFLSLSEIDEVTEKKLAQWHKEDEKRENFPRHIEQFTDFLSGDCGNCHGCEDDFEDCK
jgi:hypothetical protein